MSDFLSQASALAVGILLGAIFFGGLWWTVVRGLSSDRPALWFFSSMLVRTSITLAGLSIIGRDDWRRWLLALLGFVLARIIVKRMTRPPADRHDSRAPETGYAP